MMKNTHKTIFPFTNVEPTSIEIETIIKSSARSERLIPIHWNAFPARAVLLLLFVACAVDGAGTHPPGTTATDQPTQASNNRRHVPADARHVALGYISNSRAAEQFFEIFFKNPMMTMMCGENFSFTRSLLFSFSTFNHDWPLNA